MKKYKIFNRKLCYRIFTISGLILGFIASVILLDTYEIKKIPNDGVTIQFGSSQILDQNGDVIEERPGIEPTEISLKTEKYTNGIYLLIAGFVFQLLGFCIQEFVKIDIIFSF